MDKSTTLRTLLALTRPFKPFTVSVEGAPTKLYSRKPSAAEQQAIADGFNKAYAATRERLAAEGQDLMLTRRQLSKQSKEQLAKYIVDGDHAEYLGQAAEMLSKPTSDESVKQMAKEMEDRRSSDLIAMEHEHLLDEAMERREHIMGMIDGVELMTRLTVLYTVYDEDQQPLFTSLDDINELPVDVLRDISEESKKILSEEPATDPLKQAPSNQSAEPTQSPNPSAVV